MELVIWLDGAGVILGTLVGCLMKRYLSDRLRESMNLALAAVSVAIGVQLTGKAAHMPAAVIALLLGGVLGHFLRIDHRLRMITRLLPSPGSGDHDISQVLLVAFSLYCISTAGVIGALELGFAGDDTVLMTKALMDFSASIFFAAESGITLALISIPLVLILQILYALSGCLMPYITPEMIGDFSACGGMIQYLNAIRIARIKDPPVADFMPALVLVFVISHLWPA